MKAIEQHFRVVLFITLDSCAQICNLVNEANESYGVVLPCGTTSCVLQVRSDLILWMKPECVTIQMKAIKQHCLLHKAVLTFTSVEETIQSWQTQNHIVKSDS